MIARKPGYWGLLPSFLIRSAEQKESSIPARSIKWIGEPQWIRGETTT